jgi:hypothetical protein
MKSTAAAPPPALSPAAPAAAGPPPDWRARAVELLRHVDPSAAAEPCYILTDFETAGLFAVAPGVGGFTSLGLARRLRPVVGDRWRGEGFACVVCEDRYQTAAERIGVVLHEYCHHVEYAWVARLGLGPGADQIIARAAESFRLPAAEPVSLDTGTAPPWIFHRPDPFIRLACHVAFRTLYDAGGRLAFLWGGGAAEIVGPTYGLSPVPIYDRLLAAEVRGRLREPLSSIVQTPPPPEFAEYAAWDLARAETAFLALAAKEPPDA